MTTPFAVLPPSSWVTRWVHLLPADGPILDLACGQGRHARYLAGRGRHVVAVDRDAIALENMASHPNIKTIQADLETGEWPLEAAGFAAIVVTNYLHRPLFGHLFGALNPGGVLLYETFSAGNERFGRPSNPEFLLQPGELLERVRGAFDVVAYENSQLDEPKPAMVQRICAIKKLGAT